MEFTTIDKIDYSVEDAKLQQIDSTLTQLASKYKSHKYSNQKIFEDIQDVKKEAQDLITNLNEKIENINGFLFMSREYENFIAKFEYIKHNINVLETEVFKQLNADASYRIY